MTEPSTETLDLRGYLRPLRTRWWIVVLIAVVAAGFTYKYYSNKKPNYSADTFLLLVPVGLQTTTDTERIAGEQSVIIGTRVIARLVAKELGAADGALPGFVIAASSKGSNFIKLTSTSPDPASAVRLVNAYARVYIRYSGIEDRKQVRDARRAAERRLRQIPEIPKNRMTRLELESTIQSLGLQENASQASVQQVEPAIAAATVGPSPKRNAIFALVLGALLGLGLAYALEHLDRRIKRLEEVADLYGSPVLVSIPAARAAAKALRMEHALRPPLTEAFRTLRTTLLMQATGSGGEDVAPPHTLLVTSAIAGEGKSTVARSLALSFADAGLRVALVDADLRRPTIAASFGIDAEPGLADVLQGAPLTDALRIVARQPKSAAPDAVEPAETVAERRPEPVGASAERGSRPGVPVRGKRRPPAAPARGVGASRSNDSGSSAHLSVLTSGKTPPDPAALLAGGPVREVLIALEASHDIVIVDTSPLLPVSDAVPLLAAVDGVLIVSRLRVTTRPAVTQLTDLLARVPAVTVLGVIANDVRQQAGYGYGGYGYGKE